MEARCLFCGGDRSEPDHNARCDGRQGAIEAALDEPPATITITKPRETSVRAFYNAVDTGVIQTRREQVWTALQALGIATANEVAEYARAQLGSRMDIAIALRNAHARMHELRNLGLVREIGTKTCRVTNRLCIAWKIIPSSEYSGEAIVHRCPLCQQIVSRDVPA